MAFFTSVFKKDEPLNIWMKTAAPIAAVILWILLVGMQQFTTSLGEESTTAPSKERIASEEADDPGVSPLAVESKVIVKITYYSLAQRDPNGKGTRRPFGELNGPTQYAHLSHDQAVKKMAEVDKLAVSRTDRFRAAIVAGELLGPQETHDRLEALRPEVDPGGDLSKDIGWLSNWYAAAAKGKLNPLPQDVQEAMISRHGWFAKLAISHQQAAGDPMRWDVVSGASNLIKFEGLDELWGGLTFLAGLVAAGITFKKIWGFEPAMVETTVERSVYAEMFAIFLLGFVIFDAFRIFVLGQTGAWSVFMGEALIWSASAAFLWPLLRGVNWLELRIDLGLTSGQGILKEVGAGILGYLVSLPLLFAYHLIIAAARSGGGAEEGVKYPVFDVPMEGSWVLVIIGTISTCIWAPFFEEIFFRGALHRYLPSKLGIWGRIAITSIIFGFGHPYDVSGLIDVTIMGLVLGFLREWRGSLIAGMVAHCLHNASIEISDVVPLYLLQ
jgi:membrane protease YdiL (CAAX protease family)